MERNVVIEMFHRLIADLGYLEAAKDFYCCKVLEAYVLIEDAVNELYKIYPVLRIMKYKDIISRKLRRTKFRDEKQAKAILNVVANDLITISKVFADIRDRQKSIEIQERLDDVVTSLIEASEILKEVISG